MPPVNYLARRIRLLCLALTQKKNSPAVVPAVTSPSHGHLVELRTACDSLRSLVTGQFWPNYSGILHSNNETLHPSVSLEASYL